MKTSLGKITKVKLREIWADEARDFTPWLAQEENLKMLSEEIGRDLTLIKTEATVGRYNVDILARDEDTETNVIIENQLEETNHDHLGKLITYSAGHDVSLAIWIVKKAREEHVKAIEWLNEKASEKIGLFLIEIEALKIGNSDPAPRFNVIVRPNEWVKAIKADIASAELTNTTQKQLKFWSDLKDFIQEKERTLSCHTPAARQYYNFSIGTSAAHIALTINMRESYIGCQLCITQNKELFSFLSERKEEIEKKLSMACDWIDTGKASRILVKRDVEDPLSDDDDIRNSNMQWCLKTIIKFRQVLTPYYKEFFKNKTSQK